WIVEKFRTWCDCSGNPESIFTKDELLTNVMIYWVTQTAASSARIYYESRHAAPAAAPRVEAPTGVRRFSERGDLVAAAVARAALQHHAMDGDAARRALRGVRAAGAPGRRRARVLPGPAIERN